MTASVRRMIAAGTPRTYFHARRSTCNSLAVADGPWRNRNSRLLPTAGRLLFVEPLAQVLAGLEEGNELLGHRNGCAGARIAADARGAVLHREGAEAPELHPVAPRQRLDDLVEDDVDDALDVAVIEVLVGSCNLLNELGLDHG